MEKAVENKDCAMEQSFLEYNRRISKLKEQRQLVSENEEEYWITIAKTLTWARPWDKVRNSSDAPTTKWFAGGELNMCYNCLDRYVENGFGNRIGLHVDSPVTKTFVKYSLYRIYDEVTRLAGVLKEFGVQKGDTVMIYMPMIAEGAFAFLACCRIGAIQCSQPSGLPAQDLALRIDHSTPKVILVGSHGFHANGWINYKDIVDEACSKANHKPDKVLVLRRQDQVNLVPGRDEDWASTVKRSKPMLECVSIEATEPMYVIYTSGSTGSPKGIVHSVGGFAVKMAQIAHVSADINSEDEVQYATSNLGWIASYYIIYSTLISKQTIVFYEGDPLLTANVNALYSLIETNKITRALVSPGIIKNLKSLDTEGKIASKYNLSSLRSFLMGGENMDKGLLDWTSKVFNTTVWDCYGQTELSGLISGGINLWPVKSPLIFTKGPLFPGNNVVILKPDKTEAKPNEIGRVVLKQPLPPGILSTLLNDHDKYKSLYFEEFPGYFDTKDMGYLDENGFLNIECRSDNIMKHATVYLSGIAVENVVATHSEVTECAVISIPDLILKEIPAILYTVKPGTSKSTDQISQEILEKASNHFGEAVTFGKAIPVKELPRSRTGKIHRSSLVALRNGQTASVGALENPEVLVDIALALQNAGYVRAEK